MQVPNFDDKDLAIIVIGIIAVAGIICAVIRPWTVDIATVMGYAISAIAGIATGKALERAKINREETGEENK